MRRTVGLRLESMQDARMAALVNRRTLTIEWGQCDPAGIVFYPSSDHFRYQHGLLFARTASPLPKCARPTAFWECPWWSWARGFSRPAASTMRSSSRAKWGNGAARASRSATASSRRRLAVEVSRSGSGPRSIRIIRKDQGPAHPARHHGEPVGSHRRARSARFDMRKTPLRVVIVGAGPRDSTSLIC